MIKLKNKTTDFIAYLALGAVVGVISKYLDAVGIVDENRWMIILSYLGNLFTRLGIWVLIATFIAAYSKTLIKAAFITFIFFLGMLISYYIYSANLFGFFPTKYFIFWGSIALAAPILAIIVWKAKNSVRLAYILPALPMGLMLSLSIGMGLVYMDLSYVEELIMYFVLCVVFYKEPKQMAVTVILSFVVAFIVKLVSPFAF